MTTPQQQQNEDLILWGVALLAVAIFIADVIYQLCHLNTPLAP